MNDRIVVIYQWLMVEQLDQWWHWLLLATLCMAIVSYVVWWYRRDTVDHQKPVKFALAMLRIGAFVGLLLYFLQLDKRTEQRIVRDSKVAVLVDTSMSMSLPGTPTDSGIASSMTRSREATLLVGQSDFLQKLAKQHQVTVYRFDQVTRPSSLAVLNKTDANAAVKVVEADLTDQTLTSARWRMLIASLLGSVALVFLTISLGAQVAGAKDWLPGGWLLLLGSTMTLVSLLLAAWAIVPSTNYPIAALFGSDLPSTSSELTETPTEEKIDNALPQDWTDALAPRGRESRIGDAIKSILDREAGGPLAGIVVITDGRNNAGVDPKEILRAAQNARVPMHFIGLGSATSPPNVELVELDVPKRLYPGDRFSVNAIVGTNGFSGDSVSVQILSGATDAAIEDLAIEAEREVAIVRSGELVTATFELSPKAVGEWKYLARVISLSEDGDTTDNEKVVNVEVIERKNRVLTIAGGPTREYQFVRNLLYRDRDVESHVILQTGSPTSSQESQELLSEFPKDRTELSEYDAIVAFDADWTQIPEASVQALEQWVAEQAGGFLMVAGSVEMPKWLARSAVGTQAINLRSLSPVILDKSGSARIASGRIESATAWPLTLTSDGEQADFLWLTDDPKTSIDLWRDFSGVFGYYAAYELKPGAKALLTFSDPTAALDGQQPIYLATQFYGAGRTAYVGGGELWRIRSLGDQYFDRFYTKLIRWVSQGRLLLDSDRGVLLVDREQAILGDQVSLRAVLKNERYEPLIQSEVVVRLVDPMGRNVPIALRPLSDGSQPGVYTGQFPILLPGEYTAQLQLGGLASEEVLTASVKAKVPAVEMQRAERNDTLLRQLAIESGGSYWTGIEKAAMETENGNAAIIEAIEPQDQIAYLPGSPDREFQLRWLGWLMAWIAGCLSLEWLSRRLHRLA